MTAIKTRWVDGILNKYFGEDPEAPDFKVMPGDFEIVHDKVRAATEPSTCVALGATL